MRAVVCRAFGPPGALRVEEVGEPAAHPGAVRIAVRAVGLGFHDCLMVAGRYQVRPPLPFAPGTELAGTVIDPGGSDLAAGDRVVAFVEHGALAQEASAPPERVFRIPPGVPTETAAGFLSAYGTAHLALVDRGALAAGEWLLVRGAGGGVGLAAVDVGVRYGARVIAAASHPAKLALAAERGASALIDTSARDVRTEVMRITGGHGADVVFDPVGSDFAATCLRSAAWKARILVVGFAGGAIEEVPLHHPLNRNCSVVGVAWARYFDREPDAMRRSVAQLFAWLAEGRLSPRIDASGGLEDAPRVLEDIAGRRMTGRRVVFVG